MKRIKSKYFCIALILFFLDVSFFKEEISNRYLAPKTQLSFFPFSNEWAVQMLFSDEGERYQAFLDGIVEFPKQNLAMLKQNLIKKVIQKYLSIFLWSHQEWISEKVDLDNVLIIGDEKKIRQQIEEEWADVFFKPDDFKFKKMPESIEQKALELAVFIFELQALEQKALEQDTSEVFFDRLFEKATNQQKISVLILLAYAVENYEDKEIYNDCSPFLRNFLRGRKYQELENIFKFINTVLDKHQEKLQNITNDKKVVAAVIEFQEILNAIPPEITFLKDPIGDRLRQLHDARHVLVRKQSRLWYQKIYEFDKYLECFSLESAYLDSSL